MDRERRFKSLRGLTPRSLKTSPANAWTKSVNQNSNTMRPDVNRKIFTEMRRRQTHHERSRHAQKGQDISHDRTRSGREPRRPRSSSQESKFGQSLVAREAGTLLCEIVHTRSHTNNLNSTHKGLKNRGGTCHPQFAKNKFCAAW